MYKKLLFTAIVSMAFYGTIFSQSSSTPVTIETAISLEPKDKTPVFFESIEDYNMKRAEMIMECKKAIVLLQNEPSKVGFYREELWRLENALIKTTN